MDMTKDNRTQQVGLGCGTLIVIALIVWFFGNRGTDDVQKEVQALREQVTKLQESVEAQPPRTTAVLNKLNSMPVDELKREVMHLTFEVRRLREEMEAQGGQPGAKGAAPSDAPSND